MSFSSIQSIANVFSNSLLFSMIIDEVNDTDRVSLSCTSKSLESVTTPYIWRELDTLVPLVELLRPLRRENDAFDERRRGFKTLTFDGPLTRTSLQSFTNHARLIHHLDFSTSPSTSTSVTRFGILNPSVLRFLYNFRVGGTILPNVRSVRWATGVKYLEYLELVLHEGLDELVIVLDDERGAGRLGAGAGDVEQQIQTLTTLFHQISHRAPNLTSLRLSTPLSYHSILPSLFSILPSLRLLSHMSLPRIWLTNEVVEKLRSLTVRGEELVISGFTSGWDYIGDLREVGIFLEQIGHDHGIPGGLGGFIGIHNLVLDAALADVIYLLETGFPTYHPNLRTLVIRTPHEESPHTLREFISIASRVLPVLESLTLILVPPPPARGEVFNFMDGMFDHGYDYDYHRPIRYEDLAPLLNFPNLRDFRIDSILPIDISEEELTDIIFNWPNPNLRTFSLSPQPVYESSPSAHTGTFDHPIANTNINTNTNTNTVAYANAHDRVFDSTHVQLINGPLTLSALEPFMKYAPSLVSLALYIDATRFPSRPFHSTPSPSPSPPSSPSASASSTPSSTPSASSTPSSTSSSPASSSPSPSSNLSSSSSPSPPASFSPSFSPSTSTSTSTSPLPSSSSSSPPSPSPSPTLSSPLARRTRGSNPPPPPLRFGRSFRKLDLGTSRITPLDVPLVSSYLARCFPPSSRSSYTAASNQPTKKERHKDYTEHPRLVVDRLRDDSSVSVIDQDGRRRRRMDGWRDVAGRVDNLVIRRDAEQN